MILDFVAARLRRRRGSRHVAAVQPTRPRVTTSAVVGPAYEAGRELRQQRLGKPAAGPSPEWGWATYEPPELAAPDWLPKPLVDPAIRDTCGGAPW